MGAGLGDRSARTADRQTHPSVRPGCGTPAEDGVAGPHRTLPTVGREEAAGGRWFGQSRLTPARVAPGVGVTSLC